MCTVISSGLKTFPKIRGNAQSHQLIMQEEDGRGKGGAFGGPWGGAGKVAAEKT